MQREAVLPDETIIMPDAGQAGMLSLSVFGLPLDRDRMLLYALNENIRLKAENIGLRSRVEELEAENRRLFELSSLGCDTSGIPSSKDWKRGGDSSAAEDDAAVGKEGKGDVETPTSATGYLMNNDGETRRPGGQKNHAPAFMRIDGEREETVLHYPGRCANCPQLEQCVREGRLRKFFTGHGLDIEVIQVHRVHLLFEAADCLHDGGTISGDFPDVIGSRFYDLNVQLHILTWHHVFHASYDRVDLAAKELLGLSLSAGTANAIVARASAKILGSGFMDALRFFILLFEKVLGMDETSARVDGRNAWVHTAATDNVTLLSPHWRRGYEGAVYAGVLQFFIYTLISDCWSSYFNEVLRCKNALCNAHILRELVAAAYFRQQGWAIEMFDLLLEVFEAKRDEVEQGGNSLPQGYLDDISARYRQIVADGYKGIPGETKGKTFSLLERLRKLEDAVLAFAADFSVGFSNNVSEQSLRNLKVALRVIGQFKTMSGLVDYCVIQSFMDTCRKQGLNPYDMMRILLSGGDIIEAVFGAEKAAQIKQMIWLTNAISEGTQVETNGVLLEMGLALSENLIEAASYRRFTAYSDPPPEKKNSSTNVPKDKMKVAREIYQRSNNPPQSAAFPARIRAGPSSG